MRYTISCQNAKNTMTQINLIDSKMTLIFFTKVTTTKYRLPIGFHDIKLKSKSNVQIKTPNRNHNIKSQLLAVQTNLP